MTKEELAVRLQIKPAKSPFDARDWPLSKKMRRGLPLPIRKLWDFPPPPLNQGDTPHCGGFSVAGKEICVGSMRPSVPRTNEDGHRYYYLMKEIEGQPGNEDGVFTRTAGKLMVQLGIASGYAFADSVAVAEEFLLTQDTLLFGSAWTEGMENTDLGGFIHVQSNVLGYHLWVVRGRDREKKIWQGQNSWDGWGLYGSGLFYVTDDDFIRLFNNAGEIITAVEGQIPPPPSGCGELVNRAQMAYNALRGRG